MLPFIFTPPFKSKHKNANNSYNLIFARDVIHLLIGCGKPVLTENCIYKLRRKGVNRIQNQKICTVE